MVKTTILANAILFLCMQGTLLSHCQLPCGIYHDDMVFDQIDQYIETMYKGITVINDSKFTTPRERNETIRWVVLKEEESNEMARLITKYFLQQKIELNDPNLEEKLKSAHKLLFLLVAIKQNTDRKIVIEFAEVWEKFKHMFHQEGYECEIEKLKMKRWQDAHQRALKNPFHEHEHENGMGTKDEHAHDHDHDHEDHTH